jgi:hypothetical protein
MHGDFFLLADAMVAQYGHAIRGNFLGDTLVDVDRLVEFLAVAQEAHSPVCRVTRVIFGAFHVFLRSMYRSSRLETEYPHLEWGCNMPNGLAEIQKDIDIGLYLLLFLRLVLIFVMLGNCIIAAGSEAVVIDK